MARRRRTARRARSTRGGFFRSRRYRRSSGSSGSLLGTVLPAMAYGAVREKASMALSPLTAKIPLGNIADEVALGGLAFLTKRFIKNPTVGKICDAALVIESARIGEALISGNMGVQTSNNTVYVYG